MPGTDNNGSGAQSNYYGMAVDANGFVYLYGSTQNSIDLPTTTGSFQPACSFYTDPNTSTQTCSNFFVAKFDPTKANAASLVWVTYIGGTKHSKDDTSTASTVYTDEAVTDLYNALAVDANGYVYFTGTSGFADYPTTTTGYNPTCNVNGSSAGGCYGGVITKLSADGSSLLYSTYYLSSASYPTTASATATAISTTLTNTGNAALTISSITLIGANPTDFAIASNTCGTTLAASASCLISITFTPASAASYAATLSVSDNATGSPQTAALSGSGIAQVTPADFTLSSTTPYLTIDQGRAAQYTLVIAATGGTFSNLVTLTASGLPSGATVSFAPAVVTPGSGSATSIMTIQTPHLYGRQTPMHLPWLPPVITVALCLPIFLRRRQKLQSLLFCALLSSAAARTGCSGGFGHPPATYTLTVTATSGTDSHSTTVNLTLQ